MSAIKEIPMWKLESFSKTKIPKCYNCREKESEIYYMGLERELLLCGECAFSIAKILIKDYFTVNEQGYDIYPQDIKIKIYEIIENNLNSTAEKIKEMLKGNKL